MEDPAGSISFHQESHLKRRSGNEDGVGMCHPCQAGLGPMMAASLHGRLGFPAFSRISLQVSVLRFPLCRSEEGKYLGLEGRTGWSKGWGKAGSWGKARAGWLDSPPGWPRPTEGPPASSSYSVTHLNMCFQILPNIEMTYVDKTSVFHNLILMWFPLREC